MFFNKLLQCMKMFPSGTQCIKMFPSEPQCIKMFPNGPQCMKIISNGTRNLYTGAILQRARKGTRMKREAKKKANKKIVVKEVFIPYQKRLEMEKVGTLSPRKDDSLRPFPVDNVYLQESYRWPIYTIKEALDLHKETQHPSMYNKLNADVIASVELSMSATKKNQFIDEYSNIILLPHQFELQHNRTILTICKDEDMVGAMRQLDVTLAIGPEAVKMAEKGNLDFKLYDYIVCHASLLPDLINIRGLLKKKFPSPRNGTSGNDLVPLVTRFMKGIEYKVIKDKYDHDFGKIDVKIGTLDMDPEQIEENFRVLLNDVENSKPKTRSARVITLTNLMCGNSDEFFKIDHKPFLPPEKHDEEEKELVAKSS